MTAVHTIPFLQESIILLATAGVVVPLLQRLKLSPVLAYLLVGLAVGPFGIILLANEGGWLRLISIASIEQVAGLAELGVIFLLFMIGLELSPQKLWALRRQVLGLGLLQVVVSAAIIVLVAAAFGNSLSNSLLLGACLSLSSTAVVMQLLAERRQVATPMGRSTFSILLFQDMVVVPVLVLVGVLAGGGEQGIFAAMMLALGKAVLAICLISVLGFFLLRRLFRLAASAIGAEAFLAVALLAAIGTAALTGMAGLSMALGAFLAGLLLAESEYSHAIETYISPFKGLMLGLFFMSVGMGLDVRQVWEVLPLVSASVIGLIAIKATIIYLLQRAFGGSHAQALESGLLLGQGGEFGFVIVGMALTLGLMQPDVAQFMLTVVGLSMLITPAVAALAHRVAMRLNRGDLPSSSERIHLDKVQGHVLIVSFGRVGQLLATVLDREQVPWLAIDLDGGRASTARAQGQPVYFGNAGNPEILRRFHPETAQAVVLALDDASVAVRILVEIRQHWPALPVYARAHDLRAVPHLRNAGAVAVVPDTLEAGLQLAGRVLDGLGVAAEEIEHRLDLVRQELQAD